MSVEAIMIRDQNPVKFSESCEPVRVGSCVVERERVLIGDKESWTTTIKASRGTPARLVWDELFHEKGIITEPGSLLISQAETKERFGRAPGKSPEDYLTEFAGRDVLGICPSNANWQLGAFLVRDGKVYSPDSNLVGHFDVIGLTSQGWTTEQANFRDGPLIDSGVLKEMSVGFNMPLILDSGEVVPLNFFDPRYIADFRNVFDFAAGKKLPNEFWLYLRRLMPASESAGRRLIEGNPVVISREGAMTSEELADFQRIIEKNQLEEYLKVDVNKKGAPRLAIVGKLPLQHLPVVGVGYNQEGELIITAVDGRQAGSAGVTIRELAEIMKAKGAVTAGLGCAGGDVTVVRKTQGGKFEILNSPSNVDKAGNRVTRLEPSQLVLG